MNAPHPLQASLMPAAAPVQQEESGSSLAEYWDIVLDNRWLVLAVVLLATAVGAVQAFLAEPVFESNLLVQVEDSVGNGRGVLGEAAGLIDSKTPTAAEMEILRSRLVLGRTIDSARLYISARPRYLPVVGAALARHSAGLSEPGFLGFPGYVTGRESISVRTFLVPASLEGSLFTVVAKGEGNFEVIHPSLPSAMRGTVRTPLIAQTSRGRIELLVEALHGKPGATFDLVRRSHLSATRQLQGSLRLAEKGRGSGMVEVVLRGSDPDEITSVLNEIGRQYVKQNIERKAAEAEKTLAFLDVQMPQFKRQLMDAEERYTTFRNRQGSVALNDEARLLLNRTVELKGKLFDAQQKKRELANRYTDEHPSIRTLDAQISAWGAELVRIGGEIRQMPAVQQDALRLERDVNVNNALYQQLRNTALQLQLVREGKIGNVRVLDDAVKPEWAVGPNRALMVQVAAALGLLAGALLAFARSTFFRGIRSAQEIESETGLNVYSTIPLSQPQLELTRKAAARQPGVHLLAAALPDDPAVESLRSLRTALQFAMLDASSNRILITGATPSVGKSFISCNFAAVLASAGKRVLLIDADLRKGHLNQYFSIPRQQGLSELIAGVLQPNEVIRRNLLPNLDLITTGMLPPNPSELMVSGSLAIVLEQLSSQYDYVIVDTPPVLVAADTAALASQAGTLLLVARAEQTQLGEVLECAKRLSQAGKPVTGVLLNALDLRRRHYGSYAYKYGAYRYRQYKYGENR